MILFRITWVNCLTGQHCKKKKKFVLCKLTICAEILLTTILMSRSWSWLGFWHTFLDFLIKLNLSKDWELEGELRVVRNEELINHFLIVFEFIVDNFGQFHILGFFLFWQKKFFNSLLTSGPPGYTYLSSNLSKLNQNINKNSLLHFLFFFSLTDPHKSWPK